MISDFRLFYHALLADGHCPLHDAWHLLGLYAVAGTPHGGLELVPLLAIGGQHLGNPRRIIVADVAQMARHTEDEVVTATDVRTATHLLFQHLDDVIVRDVFVGLRVGGCFFFLARMTRIARIFIVAISLVTLSIAKSLCTST